MPAYSSLVDDLQKRATQVDAQFIGVQQKIQAETASVKALTSQELKAVVTRLNNLETLVTSFGKDFEGTRQMIAQYQAEISTLKAKTESELKRFAENANFNATVLFVPQTEKLSRAVTARLTEAGFKTSSLSLSIFAGKLAVESRRNSIVYGADAKQKAREIQDLLGSLVRIRDMTELGAMPILDWTYLSHIPFSLALKNSVRITLVEPPG